MVRHHAVIDVHGEQRHYQRKQAEQQGSHQHLAIDRPALTHHAPEPCTRPLIRRLSGRGIDSSPGGIRTVRGPGKDGVSGVARQQVFAAHGLFAVAELGQHHHQHALLRAAHQDASLALVQQQHRGQHAVRDLVGPASYQPRAEARARCGTRAQRGGQAMALQRQSGDQGLGGGRLVEVPGQPEQAVQQRIVRTRVAGQTRRGMPDLARVRGGCVHGTGPGVSATVDQAAAGRWHLWPPLCARDCLLPSCLPSRCHVVFCKRR
ncbi:hypothetical protein CBM2633_B10196 [Cupriavidus taiwanensis]|nr:hypothetical protein CBM2633_B10196 [Cupriavidus taiwanensis]